MKKIRTYLLPLLALAACGCSDDDEAAQLFDGRDNSVTSFVLTTAEGLRYEASITGDRIEVTVPETCSLDGARAEYTLCEQAVLFPDPAGITDWDNEHRFRVVAYNETLRDYFYTVRRSEVASEGSVVLLTQADVEAFAATGVSVVEGSLIIGAPQAAGEDPITDLSPLGRLTEVRYDIVINASFEGENLNGLENVVRAGGLVVGSPVEAVVLENGLSISMPSLESLGQLHINSTGITAMQFPRLLTLGQGYIDAGGLALADFPQLTVCDGYLKFSAAAGSASSTSGANTLLTALKFPKLQHVRGLLTIEKYTKLLTLDLPELTQVDGNLLVSYLSALEELSLPRLQRCNAFTSTQLNAAVTFNLPELTALTGDFKLTGSTSAASKTEAILLPKLERVGGMFQINQYNNSDGILSLPELTSVGGDFDLRYQREITTLDLPKLTHVGTQIYLYYIDQIERLDIARVTDLPKLQVIGCGALKRIAAAALLNDVSFNSASTANKEQHPVFEQPTTIAGTLEYSSSPYRAATEVEIANIVAVGTLKPNFGGSSGAFLTLTFPDLERVEHFTFTNAYYLKSLVLPKLTEVTGRMDIEYTQYMENGGLVIPALRRIGELVFNGSTYANGANNFTLRTSLDEFAEVEQIGALTIKWWGAITDFSGLRRAAASVPDDKWNITENRINGAVRFNPTKQDILDGNCRYTTD